MKRVLLTLVASVILLAIQTEAIARGSSAQLNLFERETNAVDAKGVVHRAGQYPGKIPWLADILKSVAPYYPIEERRLRHTGKGWFRMNLDLDSGAVTQVHVLQSTGFEALDNSAIAALRHWGWRPGKWRAVELTVTFKISRDDQLSRGAVRLPPF